MAVAIVLIRNQKRVKQVESILKQKYNVSGINSKGYEFIHGMIVVSTMSNEEIAKEFAEINLKEGFLLK